MKITVKSRRLIALKIIFSLFLMFFYSQIPAIADVGETTLTVVSVGVDGAKINGAGQVTLTANWASGTPSFTAVFKSGGTTIGTEPTSSKTATHVVSGSTLGQGDNKSFSVEVIEATPGATSGTANGDKTVSVDLANPNVTVALNGSTFSNDDGSNEVIITITSDKDVKAPEVTVPGVGVTPVADAINPAIGRSFRYTLTLGSAPDGTYAVNVTAKDTTLPESGANTDTDSSQTFTVQTAAVIPVTGVTITSNPESVTEYSGNVTLIATWTGGVAPYSVTFKDADDNALPNEPHTVPAGADATYQLAVNTLGDDGTSGTAEFSIDVTANGVTDAVSGNGSVEYDFTPATEDEITNISITPDVTGIVTDRDSEISLTTTWAGGVAPYNVVFSIDGGTTFPALTPDASPAVQAINASELGADNSSGTAVIRVVIADSNRAIASDTFDIQYNFTTAEEGDPVTGITLTPTPSETITDRTSNVTLSANWTGGTPAHQVVFTDSEGTELDTQTADAGPVTYELAASTLGEDNTSGTANFSVAITASGSAAPVTGNGSIVYDFTTAATPIANVTLIPSPTGTITARNTAMTLTASWTGGLSPYSAVFKDQSGATVDTQSPTVDPVTYEFISSVFGDEGASGNASYSVEITDSNGATGTADVVIAYDFPPAISTVALTVSSPGADGAKINGAGLVTLKADWAEGIPPFSAVFKSGGNTIGNSVTSERTTTIAVAGSLLGQGDNKAFSVEVYATSVSGALIGKANGDKTVSVDLVDPVVTVALNGTTFSNVAGNNQIIITVSSDKDILPPDIMLSPDTLGVTPVADTNNPTTGRNFIYTLTLSAAPDGTYTLSAIGKDTTEPNASANSGIALETFTVQSSGPGAGAITAVTPPSPTKSSSFTLSGTTDATMDPSKPIEILEDGAVVASGNATGGTWSIGLNGVTEGVHTYTMRGYNALGNISGISAPYVVKVDLTSPQAPILNAAASPTNLSSVTIVGTSAIDLGASGSYPIYVQLHKSNGSTEGARVAASADGSFSFTNVALVEGENQFYAVAIDATSEGGNRSGVSNWITIVRDGSAASVGAMFISNVNVTPAMASTSLPLADSFYLGVGTYNVEVRYGKAMDATVNPLITLQTSGGASTGNSNGTWVASDTFVGVIAIPAGSGATYDGSSSINVTGAKDISGNDAGSLVQPLGNIDTTNTISSFDSMDDIYIASDTLELSLKGVADDPGSGVGFIELIWENTDDNVLASHSIPFFNGPHIDWTYNWNTSVLTGSKYKLWVVASDRANPTPNRENYTSKPFKTVYIDRGGPSVSRISFGNSTDDIPIAPIIVIASTVKRLIAVVSDADSGIDFDSENFQFTLVHDETGNNIPGNYSNNNSNTIYFDFVALSMNGTYTVTVTPFDVANNAGETATRSFILDTEGPTSVRVDPPTNTFVNESYAPVVLNEVWGVVNDVSTDISKSTMLVKYNGRQIGELKPNASTTAVVWDLANGTSGVQTDQSWDGRYNVEVNLTDNLGNTGATTSSFFFLDTVPPVITTSIPDLTQADIWVGLDVPNYSITLSDAPKDIVQHAPTFGQVALMSGDPNWYNGAGSGVNMGAASFTWEAATAVPPMPTITGNTISIARPNMTNAPEGVVEVTLKVITADKVTLGGPAPNQAHKDFKFQFDYLAPQITSISMPDATNNKYCKDKVTVKAAVAEQGTDTRIQVVKMQIQEEGGDWQDVLATGLPSKNASITTSINIKDKADGTYNVTLRAVDKGNNTDETSFSYVVDRIGPKAPELTIPLPDFITNNKGNLFKWVSSVDADHYLLQVADDASFNNIVNHTDNPSYADLLGQVTVMTENAYSVPKDGTYYWRVAAIENCVDGYNVGGFSNSRKLIVDTVRPTVVSALPAPSEGNKITTGMVSFTIRFSEKLDTTIPPSVKLTSAGGQMMKVEMSTYSEDTWVGTTVVPSENSSLYNGTAIVSIENTRDLAGNVMVADSSNSVIVNTGPAFQTKIFSNPAHEFEIMVVTRSSEALRSPPTCSIQQSSTRTPIVMNFLKEKYYSGSYTILEEYTGKAFIDLSGTDLEGLVGHDYIQFMVAEMSASKRLNITTNSGNATLKGAEGSAYEDTSIYMLPRDMLESPFNRDFKASAIPGLDVSRPKNGSELIGIMALEELSPASLKLKKRLLYTADVKGMTYDKSIPFDKIKLYRLGGDGFWRYEGGEITDDKVSAQIAGLGRLALMADMTSPSIKEVFPSDMEKLNTPQPIISGQLVDYGSGIQKDTFKLCIDGREMSDATADEQGNFKYPVKFALSAGKHEIEVQIIDKAENTLRKSFWVTAPKAFAIDEFMPYPNPARGSHIMFNYNFNQIAERVRLRIYDTAGHKVANFDTFDFVGKTDGRIRWDLRNDSGRKVANGVYFYKLETTKNGKKYKKRGTFAVMR